MARVEGFWGGRHGGASSWNPTSSDRSVCFVHGLPSLTVKVTLGNKTGELCCCCFIFLINLTQVTLH